MFFITGKVASGRRASGGASSPPIVRVLFIWMALIVIARAVLLYAAPPLAASRVLGRSRTTGHSTAMR